MPLNPCMDMPSKWQCVYSGAHSMSMESKKQCVALSESTPNKREIQMDQPSTKCSSAEDVQHGTSGWESCCCTLQQKSCFWTGFSQNADQLCPRTQQNVGVHTHTATLPYLVVTIISIQSPCLNFAVGVGHILLCLLHWFDVHLVITVSVHAL